MASDIEAVAAPAGRRPRFSVVVSTYQRRDIVTKTLAALGRQEGAPDFEVIVVVDGSTDGTGTAVRALDLPCTLQVIEHPNCGQSRSRNRGAQVARGEILLFLDDDMEADARLLAELDRSYAEGAEVAFGRVPLHPESPRNILSQAVGRWADQLATQLAKQKKPPSGDQIYTGQLSMRREVFDALGGFDTRFAAGAADYGNEDLDIGYRIVDRGFRIAFNENAVSHQLYVTRAAVNLWQFRKVGRADVAFARKHPELAAHLFDELRDETAEYRKLRDPVLKHPRLAGLVTAVLGPIVARRIDRGLSDARTEWWFFTIRTVEYWRGVAEAGGIPRPQPVRVLCYHAIADLGVDPVLADYGVAARDFRAHIARLRDAGYHFIGAGELVRMLQGKGGVPRDAVLVTFDDAYRDVLTAALPVLREHGVPAVVFVVSSQIGGTNRWDQAAGAGTLPLLGKDELSRCAEAGIEIGAHSRTHRELPALKDAHLEREIAGSLDDLEKAGLGRPALFAYPAGEHDDRVRAACRAAGLQAAFTVEPGAVQPGDGPFSLRRIEMYRADRGWRFRLKIWTAGKVPLTRAGWRAARWRRSRRTRQDKA